MSKLSFIFMGAAVFCFGAAIISRIGEPRFYFFFSSSQYFTLTTIFVLGAILTTLREILIERRSGKVDS